MSPCRPTSVFMCVFPYGCVWLRVCGGVSGCVRVSLRVGLSVNLLENENKPGSLAAVPEPRSSAASRQTVTAGLMTEHTQASLRALLIAPSDILKQRKLETKLIAINMSQEQREAGSSPGGWELAAGREKGIGSRWSRELSKPGLVRALPKAGWALATPLTPGEAWERSSTDGLDGHVGFLMETFLGSCQVPGFFFPLVFAQIFSKCFL